MVNPPVEEEHTTTTWRRIRDEEAEMKMK